MSPSFRIHCGAICRGQYLLFRFALLNHLPLRNNSLSVDKCARTGLIGLDGGLWSRNSRAILRFKFIPAADPHHTFTLLTVLAKLGPRQSCGSMSLDRNVILYAISFVNALKGTNK